MGPPGGAAGAGVARRGNLVVMGGRGSGKSSLCRRAAAVDKRLGLLPLDELVQFEARGRSVEQIVAERGWPGFRDLEFEVAEKAGSMPGWALVDCGGGAHPAPPSPCPSLTLCCCAPAFAASATASAARLTATCTSAPARTRPHPAAPFAMRCAAMRYVALRWTTLRDVTQCTT